jgi:mono/diheme cytochrome c family protein
MGRGAAFVALGCAGAAQAAEDPVARGKYLTEIMDCMGCHTPGAMQGNPDMSRFLGGGDTGFEIPGLGIFYPPNLPPDPETGLG